VPEKGAGEASPRSARSGGKFRRPASEIVARAARRAVRGGKASFPSLTAFRAAVVEEIRRDEPLAAVGGRRLRRLLVSVPGVRLTVRYTERPDGPLPDVCPICGSSLAPVRNRTLTGEVIVIGRACPRCAYWTHAARRVPVRYTITGGQGRTPRSARS
jgi:hypothetical protein